MGESELTVDALGRLYRSHYPELLRVAEAIAGDVETARDAVHEGFVNALVHRAGFRGSGSAEGWVWRCVVNASTRTHRRRLWPVADVPERAATASAVDEDVRDAVAALPEQQRLILFLRYYGDLDYDAIAQALDIAVGTVGASLNKAHRRLRRLLPEVDHAHP